MSVLIECSNCGKRADISKKKVSEIESVIDGWGSYGNALYCPECTRTWKDRNGDKPMADQSHTFFVILLHVIWTVRHPRRS